MAGHFSIAGQSDKQSISQYPYMSMQSFSQCPDASDHSEQWGPLPSQIQMTAWTCPTIQKLTAWTGLIIQTLTARMHPPIQKLTALMDPVIDFFHSSWPPSTDCVIMLHCRTDIMLLCGKFPLFSSRLLRDYQHCKLDLDINDRPNLYPRSLTFFSLLTVAFLFPR